MIAGTRQSVLIALIVGFLCTIISVTIGITAAYMGGIVDDGLSLLTDVMLVIPTFPLDHRHRRLLKECRLLAHGLRPGLHRLVLRRATTAGPGAVTAKSRLSARGQGARGVGWYVITVELIPPMTSLIVANFLGAALYAVLASAGLQFVGLGNINAESWGTMLYWAQNNEALQTGLPLWALAPGVAIAILGSGLALLNYAFDEVANPALRPVRAMKKSRVA